jgi:hypothetical protein
MDTLLSLIQYAGADSRRHGQRLRELPRGQLLLRRPEHVRKLPGRVVQLRRRPVDLQGLLAGHLRDRGGGDQRLVQRVHLQHVHERRRVLGLHGVHWHHLREPPPSRRHAVVVMLLQIRSKLLL